MADSTYAALDFLDACVRLQPPVPVITRLRLDAALYEPPPPYSGKGRPRKIGARMPTLPTFADALALVRFRLWAHLTFQMSVDDADRVKVPRVLVERFNDLSCYAP